VGRLCEQKQDDLDCALGAYQRAANRGSETAIIKHARLVLRTQPRNSIEWVMRATERCWDSPQHQVRAACFGVRAWALWEDNRPQEAKEFVQKSLHLAPNSPHELCLYAQILESEQNPTQAEPYWARVIQHSQYNVNEQNRCLQKAYQRRQH
jgi:cytochrome c-type biogenesis protein CcmH/NrfG